MELERHNRRLLTGVSIALGLNYGGLTYAGSSTVSVLDASATLLDGGNAQMAFIIQRSGDTSYSLSVTYNTVDGSAVAGADYVSTNGQATLAAGASSVSVPVPLLGHAGTVADKVFTLHLSAPQVNGPLRSFRTPQPICCTAFNEVLRSGDFNRDGKADLWIDGIAVLLNTTSGVSPVSFAARQFYGGGGQSTAFADFNSDGKIDTIAQSSERLEPRDGLISVWLNGTADGSNTLTTLGSWTLRTNGIAKVTVADFDGDGLVDAAATVNATTILRNRTPAGASAPQFDIGQARRAGCSEAADINTDGKPDLICDSCCVALNTTPEGAAEATFSIVHSGQNDLFGGSNRIADINGDGKPDVISSPHAKVALNFTPSGSTTVSFGNAQTFDNNPSATYDLGVADVNGDGKADIVVPYQADGSVGVLLNTTPVNSTIASFETLIFDADLFPLSVAIADLNADTLPDLALGGGNQTATVLLGTQNAASLGDTDGTGTIRYASTEAGQLQSEGSGGSIGALALVALVAISLLGYRRRIRRCAV